MGSFGRLSEEPLKDANSADSANRYSLLPSSFLLTKRWLALQQASWACVALRIKVTVRMAASPVGRILVLDYFEAVIPALDYLSIELFHAR